MLRINVKSMYPDLHDFVENNLKHLLCCIVLMLKIELYNFFQVSIKLKEILFWFRAVKK